MLRLLFLVLLLPIAHAAWARPLLNVEKSSGEGILLEVNFPASSDVAQNDTLEWLASTQRAALPQPSLELLPAHRSTCAFARQNTKSSSASIGTATVLQTSFPAARLACSAALKHTHSSFHPTGMTSVEMHSGVYTRLRIEIRFTGSRQAKRTLPTAPSSALIALKRRTGSILRAKNRVQGNGSTLA